MAINCDNQTKKFLRRNLVNYQQKLHIKINGLYVHDKVLQDVISTLRWPPRTT